MMDTLRILIPLYILISVTAFGFGYTEGRFNQINNILIDVESQIKDISKKIDEP